MSLFKDILIILKEIYHLQKQILKDYFTRFMHVKENFLEEEMCMCIQSKKIINTISILQY